MFQHGSSLEKTNLHEQFTLKQISNHNLYWHKNDTLSYEEPNLHWRNAVYKSLDLFAYELIKAMTPALINHHSHTNTWSQEQNEQFKSNKNPCYTGIILTLAGNLTSEMYWPVLLIDYESWQTS